MVALNFLLFLCASLSTVVEASYTNCPKVAISVNSNLLVSRTCAGTLLRASTINNNIPDAPDAGGTKDYSTKSGFFLYEHIVSGGVRFVSIRWASNPKYALADENGQLQFTRVANPQSATIPDKFLFSRISPTTTLQEFRTKSSKRYISFESNCSVGFSSKTSTNFRKLRFNVTCKPNQDNCFCIES